ncbi:MAG: hypothetical protein L3J75_03510 [Methylococcaceae bacterium]|nr:hypothetical protein [Methylococcaceae bacterium]
MQSQTSNNCPNIVETTLSEFNGHSIYGLELILDDFYKKNQDTTKKNAPDNIDWFGLSDLSM